MPTVNDALIQGSHRSETSKWTPRVTATQSQAILRAAAGVELDETAEHYTATGDLADLSPEAATTIRRVVAQAKEGLTASQAKRIWPRKVAAVILMDRS